LTTVAASASRLASPSPLARAGRDYPGSTPARITFVRTTDKNMRHRRHASIIEHQAIANRRSGSRGGRRLALLDVCHALYGETRALGFGDADMAAVLKAIEARRDAK
jgi:3-hydroxyisobutyrate dehydrogenase